jgi:hypothetical protein
MSYRSRVYRQRNTQQNENDKSKDQNKFFNRASEKSTRNGTKNAFFQAKSNDTAAGAEDALEKEANKSATELTNQDPVKDKKEETIQKLATPEEDKQTSTNDERQKKDKEKQS